MPAPASTQAAIVNFFIVLLSSGYTPSFTVASRILPRSSRSLQPENQGIYTNRESRESPVRHPGCFEAFVSSQGSTGSGLALTYAHARPGPSFACPDAGVNSGTSNS